MNRLPVLLAACVLAALGAACSGGDKPSTAGADTTTPAASSTIPLEVLQAKADDITDGLIAGKYADVVATFNADMKAGLTASGLKTAWEQVVSQFGAYKSRATTTRSLTAAAVAGVVVFDTPMVFGSTSMKSRISFDKAGLVAGLFILKANVP
jgi:hypothetical protein